MAMSTSIENSGAPMMPAASPMLTMMSSVSPRAFMSAPSASALRLPCPAASAASQQAMNFAKIDAAKT